MPAKPKSDPHLAIAHVLFMDVVGYSKLLVNEQREVVQQLNQIVRKTAQFRKSDARGNSSPFRRVTAWPWSFSKVRRSRCSVHWKSAAS
jgi:hypothetical protein